MRYAQSHRPGFAGRHRKPANAVRPGPAQAEQEWRAVIAAVRGFEDSQTQGVGLLTALLDARRAALGAEFPVEGEDVKAAVLALSELARTLAHTNDARRGWHLASLRTAAAHCEAILDQQRNEALGRFRSAAGDD